MNILAIDTCNEILSLAILRENETTLKPFNKHTLNATENMFSSQLKAGNKQSEYILPEIDNLLHKAKLNIHDINLIAYNQGPGSFTGLRIGLSAALGLAYSINCKLVPIPAFALYVNQYTRHSPYVIVTLDARLGQIYIAGLRSNDFSFFIEPQLINPEELADIINRNQEINPSNTIFTGEGYKIYSSKILEQITMSYTHISQEYPSALNMLYLVSNEVYPAVPVFNAELLYLRNKVAMDLTEQKLNKKS